MKNEIASQRPEIKRDAYADSRANFPAGTPGRIAATMSRSVDDVPPVTARRPHLGDQPTTAVRRATAQPSPATERTVTDGDEPLQLQQFRNVKFGKLEGGNDDGNRKNLK